MTAAVASVGTCPNRKRVPVAVRTGECDVSLFKAKLAGSRSGSPRHGECCDGIYPDPQPNRSGWGKVGHVSSDDVSD